MGWLDSKDKEFKEQLLKALKDDDILFEIKKIIESKDEIKEPIKQSYSSSSDYLTLRELKDLKEKKSILDNENNNLKKENQDLKQKNTQFDNENNNLKREIQGKTSEIQSLQMSLGSEKNKNIEFKKEIDNKSTELNTIKKNHEKEINLLKGDIDLLKNEFSKLNNENDKLQSQNNYLSQRFRETEYIYNLFLNLPREQKNSLEGIFKGETIEEFLCFGVQYKNISLLWDFIKTFAIDGKDINDLNKIFLFLFEKLAKVYPALELQNVSIGDKFDDEQHIRGYNSKQSGYITKISLIGFTNDSDPVKQSVVII